MPTIELIVECGKLRDDNARLQSECESLRAQLAQQREQTKDYEHEFINLKSSIDKIVAGVITDPVALLRQLSSIITLVLARQSAEGVEANGG